MAMATTSSGSGPITARSERTRGSGVQIPFNLLRQPEQLVLHHRLPTPREEGALGLARALPDLDGLVGCLLLLGLRSRSRLRWSPLIDGFLLFRSDVWRCSRRILLQDKSLFCCFGKNAVKVSSFYIHFLEVLLLFSLVELLLRLPA
jgi:hypothetical protein